MLKGLACLLVLSLVVGGLGFMNYRRNEHLDQELENRPYKSITAEEVEMLLEAYRMEKAQLEQKLALVEGRQDPMSGFAPADLAGKVDAFDKAARNAGRQRQVRRQVLEQQVEIERLEHEQSIRARGLDNEWNRTWRRITTF